jgi:cytochrome c oxidase cbb3-type subunit III
MYSRSRNARATLGDRAAAVAFRALPALILAAVACESKSAPIASESAQPFSTFAIGPQPGPDRPLARAENPYANNKTVLADGRRLFNWYNCSGCHGDHAGGGMGPSLRDSTWRYGGDASSIFASIAEGRQYGMPAWGTKIPSDQVWRIVTYIQSLRTPDEPDAPR